MQKMLSMIFIALAVAACAEPKPNQYEVEYVYDGDTITIKQIGNEQSVRVRLMGYDTAELKSAKCEAEKALALEQKAALKSLIGGSLILRTEGIDRYDRVLAWGYTLDGKSVSEYMILEAGARSYDGGKRQPWCNAN